MATTVTTMTAASKTTITTSSTSTLNPDTLVFHLNILLVAIIGAFILFHSQPTKSRPQRGGPPYRDVAPGSDDDHP
jgi:hypothetical protein